MLNCLLVQIFAQMYSCISSYINENQSSFEWWPSHRLVPRLSPSPRFEDRARPGTRLVFCIVSGGHSVLKIHVIG